MSTAASNANVNAKILADQVWADIKRRAAAAGSAIRQEANTAKAALTPAGIGAVIGLLTSIDDIKNAKIFKEHWWLLPIAVLALGYYLHRKNSPHGKTLLAIGGTLLVQAYNNRPKEEPATKSTTTKPAGDTAGITEAVQIHPTGNGYAWIQAPTGQLIRVELGPMLRRFGPMLSTQASAAPATAQDSAARLAAAAFA